MQGLTERKVSGLQLVLTLLSVVCLMVSNITVVKLVELPFGFTMTAAMVVFPIVYILSDVFSEVYGYEWSRFTCLLAFAANVLMVAAFELSIAAPFPSYWTGQEALEMTLGNTPRAFLASMLALNAGDFVNDVVFQRMKERHEHSMDGFGARAIASSIAGEIVDSAVFMSVAMIGELSLDAILITAVTEITLKVAYELMILPLTKRVTRAVMERESA